jgi:acetyl esterase/lipase
MLRQSCHYHKSHEAVMSHTEMNAVTPLPIDADPALSADTKEFLAVLNGSGGPALETLPPDDARAGLSGLQESVSVDYSGIAEEERTIDAGGHSIKLNIVRPKGNTDTLPCFIFIHGGGWVLGDYPTHRRMVRDLVVLSGAVGIFVNYTRSPEAHYPQAVNEIYAATKWVAENGTSINVDGKRLAVVGNSVGGNMTAVTTMKAKAEHGPEIRVQILFWPIVDAGFDHDSYQRYGADRFLTTPLMKWLYDQYTTDTAAREEPYASPINATTDQLRGLPPAFIHVAEGDVLRDGGEAYGRRLDAAGVPVTTMRYNGTIHDFGLLNPLAVTPQTKALFLHAAAELKQYLF